MPLISLIEVGGRPEPGFDNTDALYRWFQAMAEHGEAGWLDAGRFEFYSQIRLRDYSVTILAANPQSAQLVPMMTGDVFALDMEDNTGRNALVMRQVGWGLPDGGAQVRCKPFRWRQLGSATRVQNGVVLDGVLLDRSPRQMNYWSGPVDLNAYAINVDRCTMVGWGVVVAQPTTALLRISGPWTDHRIRDSRFAGATAMIEIAEEVEGVVIDGCSGISGPTFISDQRDAGAEPMLQVMNCNIDTCAAAITLKHRRRVIVKNNLIWARPQSGYDTDWVGIRQLDGGAPDAMIADNEFVLLDGFSGTKMCADIQGGSAWIRGNEVRVQEGSEDTWDVAWNFEAAVTGGRVGFPLNDYAGVTTTVVDASGNVVLDPDD